MPTPLVRPSNIKLPFANSGVKNAVPVAAGTDNSASYDAGFPPVTMMPVAAGGRPPKGKDFNGVLYDISTHTLWVNAGGQYRFDSTLATFIGGYPIGMVLQNNAGTASYVCATANNSIDFNATPASIGVNWLPYSGASFSNVAIATTGGTTALTAIQAAASFISVTGTLTSNATLTVPAALAKFTVINNTTGAFTLTTKTVAGTGVTTRQATADALICDAVNVRYAESSGVTMPAGDASEALATTLWASREVSRVGGYYQDTGSVANAYIIATIPVTAAYAEGQSLRVRTTRTNTGAVTLDAGPGPRAVVQEDGGALQAGDFMNVVTVTYVTALDKWVYNGTAPSDVLDSPAFRGVPTAPTPALGTNTTQLATMAALQAGIAARTPAPGGLNAAATLVTGRYLIDTSAGAFAVSLNATPVTYDSIEFIDVGYWNINNFTINALGGKMIVASGYSSAQLIANIAGEDFMIWYDGTQWRVI